MAEIVLDLDEKELAMLKELADTNGITIDQQANQIFNRRIEEDLAEITPTTALMNQFRNL